MNRWILSMFAGLALLARGEEPALVNLMAGARLVARYQPAVSPKKPYLKELFTPTGVQVMLDSPSDHVHHHGLMFALGAGGVDFWSEKPAEKFGAQVPRAGETKAAPDSVRQVLDWTSPAGVVVLSEARTVRLAGPAAGGPNVLTWSSELRAPAGPPVMLSGSHYFGLGMRFLRDLDGKAEFLHADGGAGSVTRGDERVTPGRWCALRGLVGGKPVTVAMFDHPRNPRQPRTWFTMGVPFAYLSATLGLDKQPLALAPDAPLACRFGVAVWDGLIEAGAIEEACARWLAAEQ